ncbi:hypothetical protein [Phenylobacterium sp.]|uniref:hypothetical protein n=1 Tax=Phenylobacterium sp. TaxID=1871053 RepID=UPI0025FEB18D|nr:hypothetical protein [Phenylobacterium sp.]MBX3484906.1 hypothetical protein [Phenylobacterium sp.]
MFGAFQSLPATSASPTLRGFLGARSSAARSEGVKPPTIGSPPRNDGLRRPGPSTPSPSNLVAISLASPSRITDVHHRMNAPPGEEQKKNMW